VNTNRVAHSLLQFEGPLIIILFYIKYDWSASEQYLSVFVSGIINHCTQASRPGLCLMPMDLEGKPRMILHAGQ